jgi:hypothetical protein
VGNASILAKIPYGAEIDGLIGVLGAGISLYKFA